MLETFFRRWWLFVLVLVPFLALGVVTIGNTGYDLSLHRRRPGESARRIGGRSLW